MSVSWNCSQQVTTRSTSSRSTGVGARAAQVGAQDVELARERLFGKEVLAGGRFDQREFRQLSQITTEAVHVGRVLQQVPQNG
jgi:hypothetical protein